MKKPNFNTANLSSKRIHTQPSTLLPYFSLKEVIREGGIVAIATMRAVGNKGFRIRFADNSNSNRCLTSFALQTSFDMTVMFFKREERIFAATPQKSALPSLLR